VYDYNAAVRAWNLAEEIFSIVAGVSEETLTGRASASNGMYMHCMCFPPKIFLYSIVLHHYLLLESRASNIIKFLICCKCYIKFTSPKTIFVLTFSVVDALRAIGQWAWEEDKDKQGLIDPKAGEQQSGVNSINILLTNFLYERLFSMYM